MIHAVVSSHGSNAIAQRNGFVLQRCIANLALSTGVADVNESLLRKTR